jgi:GNAT superfamily N-acetyltransferase
MPVDPLHFFGMSCASMPAFPVLMGAPGTLGVLETIVLPALPQLDGLRDEPPEEPEGGRVDWFVCRAGFAALVCDPKDRVGTLARCWVHPDYRGHGYNDALLLCREAQARLLGMIRLRVIVRSRKAALRYQERQFGALPPFVEDGLEKHELTRSLERPTLIPESWRRWAGADPNSGA